MAKERHYLTMAQQIQAVDAIRLLQEDIKVGKYGLTELADILSKQLKFLILPSNLNTLLEGLGLDVSFRRQANAGRKNVSREEHNALLGLVTELEGRLARLEEFAKLVAEKSAAGNGMSAARR